MEHRSPTSETDHRRRLTKTNKRRHDSPLSDSDFSSSDDSRHKKRKARRSRVGLKDVKRKRRKRSSSAIGDVDATSGRKRKRSGQDHAIRPIKKSSKKKSKRVLSSSSDSDSKSCSSSQDRSCSSSGDDKRRKKKVVPDRERERLRRRGSGKGKKKHEDRSPSYTSIGLGADPSFSVGSGDEELFPVDNSRRLRSVIIVADRPRDEEENRWEMDPHKEEIVYDQHDYPSPRSADSNEGGNKMESGSQSNAAFSDRICIENIAGDKVCELGKSRIGDGDHHHSEGYMNKSEENEIDTSGGDSLESILRQKALENLRKFRKIPQTSPRSNMVKTCNETNAATLSDRTVDIVESTSTEQGISNAEEMNPIGGLLSQSEMSEVVKLPDSEDVEKKPRTDDLSITPPSNGSALVECAEEDKSSCSPAVEAKAVSPKDISLAAGVTEACSSSTIEPTLGEHSPGQTKGSSQFEQKTMTVMRGGELVQVVTYLLADFVGVGCLLLSIHLLSLIN